MKSRLVLDTNIVVRLLKKPNKTAVLDLLTSKYDVCTNGYILDEVERVLCGRFGCTSQRAKSMTRLYSRYSTVFEVLALDTNSDVEQVRDKTDQPIVDLCLQSKALYLLSGDKDLLVMSNIGQTIIKNIDFLDTLLW
jgi:uncharacterized protein